MNRSRIFTLALACIAAALVAAGCGGDKTSSASPSESVSAALKKTSEIKSGTAAIDGSVSTGSLPGSISLKGDATFDTQAEGGAAMDVELAASVAGTEQKFGFVAVDGKNYITVGDKALEQKGSSNLEPSQISSFIAGLGKNLTNVKETGEAAGVTTYTATVDVKKMITENSDNSDLSKLSIPGVGSGSDLAKSVSTADITVGVDGDGYAQTLTVDLPLDINGSPGGLRADIELSDIDQPVTIEKPSDVVKDASELGGLGAMLGN